MPRRKRTRRERLGRKEQRQETVESGVPVRAEADPAPPNVSRPSFSGAAGGLLGAGMFFALAAAILVDPGEGSRLWAIAFTLGGVCFLPAIYVSIAPHPRRERVLRVSTITAMLIAMLGLATFGIFVAVILAPPTALLAIGAGYIFQGPAAKR